MGRTPRRNDRGGQDDGADASDGASENARVSPLDPEQQRFPKAAERQRRGKTNASTDDADLADVEQEESTDIVAACAKRHSDSNLADSLSNREREDSVQPYPREHRRKEGEP